MNTGLTVRPLQGRSEYEQCVALQERTWGPGFIERVPPTLLRIAQETGGLASGAFDDKGRLLGFVFGITGWVDGAPTHWSDMLAVAAEARDRGIGDALKRHQRECLLARGVTIARWTFDPLQSRNAYLNLSRLGAVSNDYRRDYYEGSDSPLHEGIGTDRLVVTWKLDSQRVDDRLAYRTHPPSADAVMDVPLLNPTDSTEFPFCTQPGPVPADANLIRIAIPSDIDRLRRADEALATHWRSCTRMAFESAFEQGFEAREVVRAGTVAWVVLER